LMLKKTTLQINALTMISKRVERDADVDVSELLRITRQELAQCADFPCASQSQPLVAVISVLRNPPVRKLHPLKPSALSRDTITTAISICVPSAHFCSKAGVVFGLISWNIKVRARALTDRCARSIVANRRSFDPVDSIDDYGYHKGHLRDPDL
jgi:hypothetical protein